MSRDTVAYHRVPSDAWIDWWPIDNLNLTIIWPFNVFLRVNDYVYISLDNPTA